MSDASQQSAQQMVQAAKIAKAVKEATDPAGPSEASKMKLAVQKIIHTPETPADYAKRVMLDKELKNLKSQDDDS